jgi:hypothetical protein
MMRRWRSLLSVGVVLAGCHRSVEINPSPAIPMASRWNATLASPTNLAGAVQVRGSAWMAPVSRTDSSRTLVAIDIMNATPGGLHPWAVHQGQCRSDEGVFGSPSAYPPLHVKGDGTASAHTTLSIPVPTSGNYYVSVVASPSNTQTVIACGNFAAPAK